MLDVNNLDHYVISKFLQMGEFKQIDPEETHMNKYTCNSSKGCVDFDIEVNTDN